MLDTSSARQPLRNAATRIAWTAARCRGQEDGQAMVVFALVVAAIMGMLALVVDLGFQFGQRRIDQTGADAAALAAGRLLAGAVSPYPGGGLYFTWSDADIYHEALRYAGLPSTGNSPAAGAPTGVNQNAGLTSRTVLAVSLEYWNGSTWCYSAAQVDGRGQPLAPPRQPAVPQCAFTINGTAYPPQPTTSLSYKVRVTVSSTVQGFFAPAIGAGDVTPPTATADAVPACLRPAGASGLTTCAQSVVAIKGSTVPLSGSLAPLQPTTTGDCNITPSAVGMLIELWGSSSSSCGYNLGSWQYLLDFTDERYWCDNSGHDYTKYRNLLPAGAWVTGGCAGGSIDASWNRSGFTPDAVHPGSSDASTDVAYWIARGFGGAIRPDSPGSTDGNWFPTYCDVNPSGGCANMGQNIATGFYCGSGATDRGCPSNPAGTYFFAKLNPDGSPRPFYYDVCPDRYGQQYGLGCRDATVVTWATNGPQWATGTNQGGTGWATTGGGAPDRVRGARLLTFRLYCGHSAGLCTDPPKALVGNAANSTVWGLFMAPVVRGPCATCTTGPSLYGNAAALES